MYKLGVFNCEKNLKEELSKSFEIIDITDDSFPDIDFLFVDWITQYNKEKENIKKLLLQTSLIEYYLKNTRIILFDRYIDISEKEFNFMKKYDVCFLEPMIHYRKGFDFMPFWCKVKGMKDLDLFEKERNIDIAHKGKIFPESFQHNYISLSSLGFNVKYWSRVGKEEEEKYLLDNAEKQRFSWDDVKCSVIIGNETLYKHGYLHSDMFDMIDNGCMPLLPEKNRWFTLLFKDVIIRNIQDIQYFIDKHKIISYGVCLDIYNRINKYFPEMKVNYTTDYIKYLCEK